MEYEIVIGSWEHPVPFSLSPSFSICVMHNRTMVEIEKACLIEMLGIKKHALLKCLIGIKKEEELLAGWITGDQLPYPSKVKLHSKFQMKDQHLRMLFINFNALGSWKVEYLSETKDTYPIFRSHRRFYSTSW